jgi:hypothetical protein
MVAEKYSASMDSVLLGSVRLDAGASSESLSSWLSDAAADRLRVKGLRQVVADWEAEHGEIADEELRVFDLKLAAARLQQAQRAFAQLAEPGLTDETVGERLGEAANAAARVVDLMAALEASVAAAKERRAAAERSPTAPGARSRKAVS